MADIEKDNTMWNVDMEVNLFHAMRRHKPVGVNKYFQMMFIHEKLNNSSSRKITSKQIWKHLSEMYDLQALNESEIIPFPNKEGDFFLPDSDYNSLMDRSFPRFETDSPPEDKNEVKGSKAASSDKKGDKSSKDTKGSSTPHSKDSKSDGKGTNTPHGKDKSEKSKDSKSDNKGTSTPHSKEKEGRTATPHSAKGGKATASTTSTPESTPKRKRTRQTNSANASPATPSDSQPTKRGRR